MAEGTYRPSRALGGWLATYAQLGENGEVVPTKDRQGHIFEAAGTLGRIDFTEYLKKGLWNDTHEPIHVGVPTSLEFHGLHEGGRYTALSKAHGKLGWWTEGHLWDRNDPRSWTLFTDYEPTSTDLARADYYWGLVTMLKGLPRPLGFSADGEMLLSPCGERIIWARVRKNAVCEVPQNPDAAAFPLQLAVPGDRPLLPEMVGKRPCDSCRCPPGARCPVRPLQLAVTATEHTVPTPEDLEGSPKAKSPEDASGGDLEFLVQTICERQGCDRKTALRWVRSWLKSQAMARPDHTECP